MVAFIRRLGIGESIVNHGLLLPADLALPFLVIGFADWMEDRRLRAGLMLGLSGLIHANFAVIGPLVIAIPEIAVLVRTRKPLPSLKLALGFLLLAWPSLVLAAMGFFAADTAPGAIRILFEYRSPHHYDPPLVNGPAIYWPLVLLAASMPVWLSRKAAGAKSANALVLVLALVLSQLVAAIATALGSAALVRLFLWRLSIPLILLSAIAFGEVLVNAVRRHRPFDIAFGLSAALLVLAFATNGAVQFTPQVSLRGFGMLIPFASCLAVSAIACRIEHAIFKYAALGLAAIPFVAAGLFSTPLVESKSRIHWAEAAERALTLKMPSSKEIRGERPSLAVLSWIEKHTPKEAKFLAPPGLDGFRLEARRAVFVDWKCCPMKGEEIAEWERRMKAVMGTKSLPAKGFALHRTGNSRYFARSLKSLAALARKEGLTFILARPSDKVPKDLEKIVTQGPWSVYRVL